MLNNIPCESLATTSFSEVMSNGAVTEVHRCRMIEEPEVVSNHARRGPGKVRFDPETANVAIGRDVPLFVDGKHEFCADNWVEQIRSRLRAARCAGSSSRSSWM